MYFNAVVSTKLNALGVDRATELFPTAASIEAVHVEPYEKEVRVTYAGEQWELPAKAAENLIKAWPDQVDAIMQVIQPHYGGFFGFNRWGMFVGVEPDGYIHT